MKKNQLENLLYDLENTSIPIETLALKYAATPATIHNIDKGRSYFDPTRTYPIRQQPTHPTIDSNKIAWLQENKHFYKPAVAAAILQINYQTACKYYAAEPQPLSYTYDAAIEQRKYVVDVMAEPRPEFIHDSGDIAVTWNDAVYLRFLYTFNKDEAAIIWCYKKWLDEEFPFLEYPIAATLEELRRYLEWDGTKSKLIWFIKGIGNGKIKTVQTSGGQYKNFYYNDFDTRRFRPFLTKEQMTIAAEIAAKDGLGEKRNKVVFEATS